MEQDSHVAHASHRLRVAKHWQARDELDELCDWWRTCAFGVCVLEGMPGCGKTAIVDRFLRVLPGGYPQLPDVAKADLPSANGTFVFSFFDGSEDVFFADLARWLTDNALDSRPASYGFASEDPGYEIPVASTASYRQLLSWLASATARHGKLLLVLDGLDRVQDASPGADSLGRITDTPLKNLIVDAADGLIGIAVVATTRYPLADLEDPGSAYLHQIRVGELSAEACSALLRARGVRGDDDRLTVLARAYGMHAFSLDLLGGYIGEYCDGEAERLHDTGHAVSAGHSALESVVDRYRTLLSTSDPAALAILERLCLFRMGTTADRLERVFLRKGLFDFSRRWLSGAALARLSRDQLRAKLDGLSRMNLILESTLSGVARYSVHPALNDALLPRIPPRLQVEVHKAVLADAAATDALGANGEDGSDPIASLDDFEALIYHALGAGSRAAALDLYLGSVAQRDWGPQGYHRDERLCRAIAAGQPDIWRAPTDELLATLPPPLTFAWGTALDRLGRLEAAAACFEFLAEQSNDPNAFMRLYDVWLERGQIQIAWRSLEHWVAELVRTVEYDEYNFILPIAERLDGLTKLRGHARALAGVWDLRGWRGADLLAGYVRVPPAIAERPVTGIPGIHRIQLQLRLGRIAEASAEAHVQAQYAEREHTESEETAAFWMRFRLVQAEIALARGKTDEALDLQQQGQAWAAARDANEVLCWSQSIRAQIEMAPPVTPESLAAAMRAADGGLRLARSCGFAVLHVDLLIVRARALLAAGRPDEAEQDLVLALHGSSSRPEDAAATRLLAATASACGYARGIVLAGHWLGVACLAQAAQWLESTEFDPARESALAEPVRAKLALGAQHLRETAGYWQKLAATVEEEVDLGGETRAALEALGLGRLPELPLHEVTLGGRHDQARDAAVAAEFDVFLSYNGEDRESVRRIAEQLAARGIKPWFDDAEIAPGSRFQDDLSDIIPKVRASAVFIGASGTGPWQVEEIHACLRQSVYNGQAVIPVLLPNAAGEPDFPLFLQHRSRVDLRMEQGFDRLLWAIRGTKPPDLGRPRTVAGAVSE